MNSEQGQPRTRLSGEERDALVRAQIAPLEPGERPWPLMAAAALCGLLAIGNLAAAISGVELSGRGNPAVQAVALAALLTLLGAGIWLREAIAVLVFEALLLVTMLVAILGVISAGNTTALVASSAIIVISSVLFWKLIRVLARIQAPVSRSTDVPPR